MVYHIIVYFALPIYHICVCIYVYILIPNKGYEKDSNKEEAGKARTKAIREKFVAEDLPRFMDYYTNKLEQTGAFFCGAEPTIADLYILPQYV